MYHVREKQRLGSPSSTNSLSVRVRYLILIFDSSLLPSIILNLICFIAPIGSLRSVSETLFQRLCLSQTTNERSDLLIVLNEVTDRSGGSDLRKVILRLGDYQ